MGQRNSRSYDSFRRAELARENRRQILAAARSLFCERGYEGTTVAAIATEAGVAVDTVYASVGRKAVLFRLLLETAISGEDEPVPALERDYVRQVRSAATAPEKLDLYAKAITQVLLRLGPLFLVLREAAPGNPELASLWQEISERRAQNMRLFAADVIEVAAEGELRAGMRTEEMADVVWATNSPDFYALLVMERGWTPQHFSEWLSSSWRTLFFASSGAVAVPE